jgi:hypothetical protein
MKTAVAAILMFLFVGCDHRPTAAKEPESVTDAVYVRRFLETWLLKRDLNTTKTFISAHSMVAGNDRTASSWPPALQGLPPLERTLRFPFACPGFPSTCERLRDCIRPATHTVPGEFEQETIKVDENVIVSSPELKPFRDESLVHVTFLLKGCNTGVSLLILPKGTSAARVVQVFYLAG